MRACVWIFANTVHQSDNQTFGRTALLIPTSISTRRQLVEAVLVGCRSPQSPLGFTEEQLLDEHLISWFLKDLGAAPLDFRGYVTGAEVSDDEEAGSADVAAEMGQGYHSGFLLKKSSRDPCLWRRRWCVLGEDRLWYMKLKRRRAPGRAAAISLVANHVVEHPPNSVGLDGWHFPSGGGGTKQTHLVARR